MQVLRRKLHENYGDNSIQQCSPGRSITSPASTAMGRRSELDPGLHSALVEVWKVLDWRMQRTLDPQALVQSGWPPQDLPSQTAPVLRAAFLDFFAERFRLINPGSTVCWKLPSQPLLILVLNRLAMRPALRYGHCNTALCR